MRPDQKSLLAVAALGLSLGLIGCNNEECSCDGGIVDLDGGPDATYSAGPFTIDPGTEKVICTYVKGENAADEDVSAFYAHQTLGGHHLIAYTVDHSIDLPPTPCVQGGQPGWIYTVATQDQDDEMLFPAGVGLHIKAHQQFVIETHYINATTSPMTVSSSFSLKYAPVGSVTMRASPYYFGSTNLNLPPQASWNTDATCTLPAPVTLYTIVGHEHRYGTGVTVGLIPATTHLETLIYQTEQWDSPPPTYFQNGLALAQGDKIHVTCDWINKGTQQLTFPQEMCFAVGAYWPGQGELFCSSSGGNTACGCGFSQPLDTGPGGSTVKAAISWDSSLASVPGIVEGHPIYCAAYRKQDWATYYPVQGASPYYVGDVEGIKLTDPSATAELTFWDVTPGDYVAGCYMDTIAGGSAPGSGDPTNVGGTPFTAIQGQTATPAVHLNLAIP